jgi:CHAD domain-containing protein
MAFAFKARSAVSTQVRSIAAGQVEKALASAKTGEEDFDATVHGLRRRCKKLRGLLRMVEPHLAGFKPANAAIRDAADLLGGARDARVMVETLDALVGGKTGHAAAEQAIVARQFLLERLNRVAEEDSHATVLDRFAEAFTDLQATIADWDFDARGFAVIGDGLEETYRLFRKQGRAAEKRGTAEALHDWRKQAKYHGHHVALLKRSAPSILDGRGKALVRLGDLLGDHHNLAVLEATLLEASAQLGDMVPMRQAIAARQDELAQAAFTLGRQLAAERAGALRERFLGYWHLLPRET